MPDVFTVAKRSEVMSRIRGRGNRDTELAIVKLFRRHRITGWRRHQALFGKPDFVFKEERLALFVDGCFWHSCPKHATKPRNNAAFWQKKLASNMTRDILVVKTLSKQGWSVLRIWEHELAQKNEAHVVRKVLRRLMSKPTSESSTSEATHRSLTYVPHRKTRNSRPSRSNGMT